MGSQRWIASAAMAFSFRQIQYFVAAAEKGAVSRAAHELSISQSTVAEAIRELEADLGFPLFERKAQGVELTLKGNQFLRHARKILADVAEARRCPARTATDFRRATGAWSDAAGGGLCPRGDSCAISPRVSRS